MFSVIPGTVSEMQIISIPNTFFPERSSSIQHPVQPGRKEFHIFRLSSIISVAAVQSLDHVVQQVINPHIHRQFQIILNMILPIDQRNNNWFQVCHTSCSSPIFLKPSNVHSSPVPAFSSAAPSVRSTPVRTPNTSLPFSAVPETTSPFCGACML